MGENETLQTMPETRLMKYHGWKFNIFNNGEKYEGWIFDRYMRVKVKTFPYPSRNEAIKNAHYIIGNLNKGMANPGGVIVDEGAEILKKEMKEIEDMRKEARKNRN